MEQVIANNDWSIVKRFLPYGWEDKAYSLYALVRKRKIPSAEVLLRVLLIHLVEGKSLRTTAAYANETNLCDVNDAALLNRLRASSSWFRWMANELVKQLKGPSLPDSLFKKYRVRLVDGSIVKEPGATGSNWRIHYSYNMRSFACDTFKISDSKAGECLQRFPIEQDDLIIGDRGYCKRKGIIHVLNNKGQLIVRFHSTNLPLFSKNGTQWSVIDHLKSLGNGKIGDWDVWFKSPENGQLIKGRFCAIRKSAEAIKKSIKKAKRESMRMQTKTRPQTLVIAEYICLFTTVNRHIYQAKDILMLYKGRWQIELAFKRLKSIIGLGHLPKYHEESCIAWLHGKMFIALLVERIYQEADSFSPWGYPIEEAS